MREGDKASRKHISQHKKYSVSEKTRSDNPSQSHRDEPLSALPGRAMKSLGKKYAQDNIFKTKEKEHHEIVISDELVRNSKQYRMLRQKYQMGECLFQREISLLSQTRTALLDSISTNRAHNHNSKLSLWELKNQILQLKGILNDEEEEGRRLEAELQTQEQEFQGEQEEERESSMGEEQQHLEEGGREEQPFSIQRGEQMEGSTQIRLLMVQMGEEGVNPQQLKKQQKQSPLGSLPLSDQESYQLQ